VSRRRGRRPPDPFAALGLAARPDLTDDDIRAAWRRVATATHPDREDGGDPARFAAAAAAYTQLRTAFGRGEAMADAQSGRTRAPEGTLRAGAVLRLPTAAVRLAARIRRGRPARLALRVLAAAAASAAALAVAGSQPAGPALATGAVTWLVLTARHDLAPPG
jgi:hypothetical protein